MLERLHLTVVTVSRKTDLIGFLADHDQPSQLISPVACDTGPDGPFKLRQNGLEIFRGNHLGQVLSLLMMRHREFVILRRKRRSGFPFHRLMVLGKAEFITSHFGRLLEIVPSQCGDNVTVASKCSRIVSFIPSEACSFRLNATRSSYRLPVGTFSLIMGCLCSCCASTTPVRLNRIANANPTDMIVNGTFGGLMMFFIRRYDPINLMYAIRLVS